MDSLVYKQPNVTTLLRLCGAWFALRYVEGRLTYRCLRPAAMRDHQPSEEIDLGADGTPAVEHDEPDEPVWLDGDLPDVGDR